MKNFVEPGEVITLTAPYAVSGGDGVLVGMIFGVFTGGNGTRPGLAAQTGDQIEVAVTGAATLAKTTGVAWVVGDPVYWDNAGKKCTKTNTGNKFIGYAIAAAASADAIGVVLLSLSKDVLA